MLMQPSFNGEQTRADAGAGGNGSMIGVVNVLIANAIRSRREAEAS